MRALSGGHADVKPGAAHAAFGGFPGERASYA
jgi:hypothetical protein